MVYTVNSYLQTLLYLLPLHVQPNVYRLQIVVGGDGGCGTILEHSAADAIPAMNMDTFTFDILNRQVLLWELVPDKICRMEPACAEYFCQALGICGITLAIIVCLFSSEDRYNLLQEASPMSISQTTPAERLLWNVHSDTIRDIGVAKHNIDRYSSIPSWLAWDLSSHSQPTVYYIVQGFFLLYLQIHL